jgi:hypothetical protein
MFGIFFFFSLTEHGGLQVLLVTGQVDEGDDLGGLFAHPHPVKVAVLWTVDNVAHRVEPEDVVAHRGRSARFGLVFVPEQPLTGKASTIVKLAMSEYTK